MSGILVILQPDHYVHYYGNCNVYPICMRDTRHRRGSRAGILKHLKDAYHGGWKHMSKHERYIAFEDQVALLTAIGVQVTGTNPFNPE